MKTCEALASANAPNPVLSKFQHPDFTATGERRARVALTQLETVWINTGTLCNVECAHCYIESSPTNDALAYLTASEARDFISEAHRLGANEIGFTGGEPFMNPEFLAMLEETLRQGLRALVLTNAMRPMMRPQIKNQLVGLQVRYGKQLALRISLDHFSRERHDEERGPGCFDAGMAGFQWLSDHGFSISVAGRTLWGESEEELRAGFASLFKAEGVSIDANDPHALILFPELDERASVPEISENCWDLLGKSPGNMMCATSRMVVKRKGAAAPTVLSCTLLPYDKQFEMGASLQEASSDVKLNHPHCAKFCVLGGASCSG